MRWWDSGGVGKGRGAEMEKAERGERWMIHTVKGLHGFNGFVVGTPLTAHVGDRLLYDEGSCQKLLSSPHTLEGGRERERFTHLFVSAQSATIALPTSLANVQDCGSSPVPLTRAVHSSRLIGNSSGTGRM